MPMNGAIPLASRQNTAGHLAVFVNHVGPLNPDHMAAFCLYTDVESRSRYSIVM